MNPYNREILSRISYCSVIDKWVQSLDYLVVFTVWLSSTRSQVCLFSVDVVNVWILVFFLWFLYKSLFLIIFKSTFTYFFGVVFFLCPFVTHLKIFIRQIRLCLWFWMTIEWTFFMIINIKIYYVCNYTGCDLCVKKKEQETVKQLFNLYEWTCSVTCTYSKWTTLTSVKKKSFHTCTKINYPQCCVIFSSLRLILRGWSCCFEVLGHYGQYE